MDVDEINHGGNCIEDESNEQLLSAVSMDAYNVFEDPEVLPRVGDQYQVEIPPLITESDRSMQKDDLSDVKNSNDMSYEFFMGLPVSIMWIRMAVEDIKQEFAKSPVNSIHPSNKNVSLKETHNEISDLKPRPEAMEVIPDGGNGMNLKKVENLALPEEYGYFAVPGQPVDPWSDLEEESFLLGLYIFGKNLVLVKKFVGSKNMGDILSFYYGRFYGSETHRRWSECQKMRRKKCVYGQRIFTGWRQQELLSRLIPHVSEESRNTLLEATKAFGEGKSSLEEYVFILKATVGLNALINAIGIGKGKEDLTALALEPFKANPVVPARPEIPAGKACSALSSLEIINFLTGNYRMSKARSNDLFWEAVWPRLLARGWHSEQPPDQGYTVGSKHYLVFLIPGVKKFSRKKLVKGDHYFDSISDVLSKVASDPGLLELEIQGDKGDRSKDENGTESDKDDHSTQERHRYLKPRIINRGVESLKFTVVDTSLQNGGKFKVRELRSLPIEMNISNSLCDSEESTSDEHTDESDLADTSCSQRVETNGMKFTEKNYDDREVSPDGSASNNKLPVDNHASTKVPAVTKERKTKVYNGLQPRKVTKNQPSHRLKDYNKNLNPVTKRRRRLSACTRKETAQKQMNILGNPDGTVEISSKVGPVEHQLSSGSSSSRGSPNVGGEDIVQSTGTAAEQTGVERPRQLRTLIDLNLPVPDAETDEPFMGEVTEGQHGHTNNQHNSASQLEATSFMPSSELQPNMNARRVSTRNRPPTAKALEALACGFLNATQKRKRKDGFSQENSSSRPSPRARGGNKVSENDKDSVEDFKAEDKGNGNGVVDQTSDLTQLEMDSNLGVP